MRSAHKGGEWFLAFGILLLCTGLLLWAILPGTWAPPLLAPALFSIAYGVWCLWRRGQNGAVAVASAPQREMLMMVRRRKTR